MSGFVTDNKDKSTSVRDHIPLMVVSWDVDAKKYKLNSDCETILGWSDQDANSVDFMSVLIPDLSPGISGLEIPFPIEPGWRTLNLAAKNGTFYKALGSSSVVRDDNGRATQCIMSFLSLNDGSGTLNDTRQDDGKIFSNKLSATTHEDDDLLNLIESLEQRMTTLKAQLLATNREMEAFTYSVSHDLRAPLRGIHGFINFLMADHAANLGDDGMRICSVILDNSLKMGELIEHLHAFSRLNQTELNSMSMDMNDLIRSICYEMTEDIPQEKLNLHIEKIHTAPADPFMIRQVWSNLISNAIKFSSKRDKRVVSISSQIMNGKCIYCIRDNGVGFDMAYAEKLFVVFQRLHKSRDYEGNGMGLAIVQRIIHRHGGEVWAEGIEDQGAAFYFSLPLQ